MIFMTEYILVARSTSWVDPRVSIFWKGQIFYSIVLLAYRALAPIRITASFKSTLSQVQQFMVCGGWAYNQICRIVVELVTVNMVNFRSMRQWFAKYFFSNNNVRWLASIIFLNVQIPIDRYRSGTIRTPCYSQWISMQKPSCIMHRTIATGFVFAPAIWNRTNVKQGFFRSSQICTTTMASKSGVMHPAQIFSFDWTLTPFNRTCGNLLGNHRDLLTRFLARVGAALSTLHRPVKYST